MNPIIIAAVIAAVVTVIVFVGIVVTAYCLWKAWKLVTQTIETLNRVEQACGELVGEIRHCSSIVSGVRLELSYLRTALVPPTQAPPDALTEDAVPPTSPPAAGKTASPLGTTFPDPVFDRYPTVLTPDATTEDTDRKLLEQTDEDLVEQERIEGLRELGIQVEADDVEHEGIHAESP